MRDANGRITGRLNGGFPMIELAIGGFPAVSSERQIEAIRSSFAHLNSIGLTTVYDPAGVGIRRASYARLRDIADELTVRIYHTLGGRKAGRSGAMSSISARLKSAWLSMNCASLQPPNDINHSPSGRLSALASRILSASPRLVMPSSRASFGQYSVARFGSRVLRCRSCQRNVHGLEPGRVAKGMIVDGLQEGGSVGRDVIDFGQAEVRLAVDELRFTPATQ